MRVPRPPRRAIAALALLAALAAGAPFAAAATAPAGPAVLSFAAAPKRLGAGGGPVRLTARVAHASACTFRGQSAAFSSINRVRTVSCAHGRATAVLTVEPNTRTVPATIHYYVRAAAKGRSVQRTLTLVEAAASDATTVSPPPATPPAVASGQLPNAALGVAYSTTLSVAGGTPPYVWRVASGALPAGTSLSVDGTIAGTPTEPGTFDFTVEVVDAGLQSATADLSLVVASGSVPVQPVTPSFNWSGYALDAGPFTSVTGTFNVPDLTNLSRSVNVSEWVGIDGDTAANEDLIQAGVAENYSRFGGVSVYAWWEILPAVETQVSLAVKPGDTVTVTIAQVGAGQWSIRLLNATSGETFSTTQSYSGQALSAEWIVEAPSDQRDHVTTLGQYAPAVTFSQIGWVGSATSFTPIELRQNGVVVSSPSPLDAAQSSFAVAYGETAPPAPG